MSGVLKNKQAPDKFTFYKKESNFNIEWNRIK